MRDGEETDPFGEHALVGARIDVLDAVDGVHGRHGEQRTLEEVVEQQRQQRERLGQRELRYE